MSADDEPRDRGVDVDLLVAEIEALRDAALRYGRAVDAGQGVGGAGLDLETAALRYVRKLDDELRKSREVDYAAIVEEAERSRGSTNN